MKKATGRKVQFEPDAESENMNPTSKMFTASNPMNNPLEESPVSRKSATKTLLPPGPESGVWIRSVRSGCQKIEEW